MSNPSLSGPSMNIVDPDPRTLLTDLFYVAVATAQPARVLAEFLPANRVRPALVICLPTSPTPMIPRSY